MRELFRDWRLYVFGSLFLFNLLFTLAFSAPRSFPSGNIIDVRTGSSLAQLANELELTNIVKSSLWFRIAVITLGGEYQLKAGSYHLKEPENALTLAWRMVKGDFDLNLVKITIPEGFTNKQIANLFDERFIRFDETIFDSLAEEGYLFPDTYFMTETITAGQVIDQLRKNFERQVGPLKSEFGSRSEHEIITMASIIQAEVRTPEDMAMVSGVLWKRLEMGMALQVDPEPKTYEEPGLPQKPLNNPGLGAIKAAINPTKSDYLYFLSDKKGITHYARTLEEHIQNIQKYL